jgi:hypothetical protein
MVEGQNYKKGIEIFNKGARERICFIVVAGIGYKYTKDQKKQYKLTKTQKTNNINLRSFNGDKS